MEDELRSKVREYEKRPIRVKAIKFTGENREAVLRFAMPQLSDDAINGAVVMQLPIVINTLEGDMLVSQGDYVIQGIKGEFYPCKPDIFEATYCRLAKL